MKYGKQQGIFKKLRFLEVPNKKLNIIKRMRLGGFEPPAFRSGI